MSLVVPGLLGTFGTYVGHPGMSLVVPGLLGTGNFSSYLVGHPGTSLVEDPRTSLVVPATWDFWDWDF